MANGLRKLIKKARRFSNPSITNGRLRKFGQRLRVEELEERIAPAAVTLVPGEFTTYDGAGDGVWADADDYVIGLSGAVASDNTLATTVTDIDVTVVDSTTPVITDIGWSGAATETLVLMTNGALPSIDITALTTTWPTTTTTLRLVVLAGVAPADGTGATEITFTDSAANTYSYDTYVAGESANPSGSAPAGHATEGIGTLTMPAVVNAGGLSVQPIIETGATGTLAGLASTATNVDMTTAATFTANIGVGALTTLNWGGSVLPAADGITIAATDDAGAGMTSVTLGTVTAGGAGSLAVNSEGIGGLTITNGITASAAGNVSIDADNAGATDDSMGAVVIGGITISGAGNVTIDGGDGGLATVSTGAITVSGAGGGDLLITTSTNGAFSGLVTTGAITNSGTNASTITIQPAAAAASMSGFTATGLISNAAAAVNGALVVGQTGGALGALTLSGITLASTNAGGDMTFQGDTIGTTSLGAVAVSSTAAADLAITAATSIGAFTSTSLTASGTGDITVNGGSTGFTGTVGTGPIVASGAGGGDILITTTNGAGTENFAGLVTTGAITNSGTNDSDITIQPAGTGTMAGFTATGLISNTAAVVNGAILVGNLTGATGAVTLTGITVASTSDAGDVTIQGNTLGAVLSNGSIMTADADTTDGDILVQAVDGMGNITVASDISGGGQGGVTNATVTFDGDQDNDGTGVILNIDVNGNIGNDTGTNGSLVTFTGSTIGTVDANYIGLGGPVTFTTNDGTNANGTIGTIGATRPLLSLGEGGAVQFLAHDGISIGQDIVTQGSIAAGGTVTFSANLDGADDAGGLPNFQAGTTIGTTGANQLTLNTNGGATDNTTERDAGTISALDGFARLNLTIDGDQGLISVSGDAGGNGNDLEIFISTIAAGDPTNVGDLAGINVADTANTDSVTVTALSSISGIIGSTGGVTNGSIIAGGGEAADNLTLNGNLIIYNGDDTVDGIIDVDYAATTPFFVDIVSGSTLGGSQLIAATLTSSPFFQAVLNGETFLADVDTPTGITATVTYQLVTDQIEDDDDIGADLSHQETDSRITLDDINGLTSASELTISTSGGSEFDCGGITRSGALGANPDVQLISMEGDLYGNIGEVTQQFGDVEIIIVAGDASAANANGGANHTFYGSGLQGLGVGLDNDFIDANNDDLPDTPVGFSNLLLGPNVIITTLDRDTSEPLTLPGTLWFQFADAVAGGSFNRHIIVVGVGSEAIVYGIDGAGDSAAALDAEYAFDGVGVSAAQAGATNSIDPENLIDGYAMLARVNVTGITGLSTDVSVRETDGTTSGSWLEYYTDSGLVNLTTQLASISVGIDDNADAVDNVVLTGDSSNNGNGTDFDRLGGGEAGSNKRGLEPATFISDANAALGNFVAQSMNDPGAANISIAVTGNSGPITLTGDAALLAPDHGYLTADPANNAAAIAIGGNLEGAISIPGAVNADILIGIGLDLNGDGDDVDSDLDEVDVGHDLNGDGDATDTVANLGLAAELSELPSGSANANIIVGSMTATEDILVYNDVNNDIVIAGQDQDPENLVLELPGDVDVIKAGGDLGDLGDDVVVIQQSVDFIIADGALNSGIFVGGAGNDVIVIEGTGINGPGVIGGSTGVTSVNFLDHEVYGDAADSDTIAVPGGTGLVIQWAAGGFGDGTDTLGDAYVIGDDAVANLNVTTANGDAMNVGNIFLLDDGTVNVTSPGGVGVVVAADDATVPTSEALQDTITTSYDVVNSPTDLDTASGDQAADLSYDGAITTENAGGVVAEGDVDVQVAVDDTMGYIVALNGHIGDDGDTDVHAGVAIGHIVASINIDGEFVSEGTLAVGDATGLQADLVSFGLSGVPSWFPGGILAEVGDIGSTDDVDDDLWTGTKWSDLEDFDWQQISFENYFDAEAVFTAVADPTIVQGHAFWTGEAMGTIYAPAGGLSADINVGGDFGGIQVPAGNVWVELTVPMEAMVSRVIAPQFVDDGGNADSSWDRAGARGGIRVIDGELVAVVGADLDTDGLDVSVTGATTLAIIDGTEILLVGGLASGSSLDVQGDVVLLTVDGNWDGSVVIDPNVDDDSEGIADTIVVTGNVGGSADLEAYNFGELLVQGSNAAVSTGSLSGRDSITFTNLAGDTQTLFLDGSNRVSADYETTFGKLTEVEITGNGSAGVVSVMGSFDAATDLRELRAIEKAGRTGSANADLDSEGSAHIGELAVVAGSRVNLKDVVVNGALDEFAASKNVRSLWVSDDAGTIDVGNKINKAFIGGDVDEFSARIAKNLLIGEDAGTISARVMLNSTAAGNVGELTIDGRLVNSIFADVDSGFVNRSIRSVPGAGVI
jgi:hypothetical protein